MIYLNLFLEFFQIGLFSIGGGYAAIPLIQNRVVDVNGWLAAEEMVDLITISQMTPGPIGVNTATFVGIRVGGVLGAVVSTLGLVTPSCIIVLVISYFYFKYKDMHILRGVLSGIRPAVVALIGTAAITMIILSFWEEPVTEWTLKLLDSINYIGVASFVICLFVLLKFKVNPIFVIAASGVSGIILYRVF